MPPTKHRLINHFYLKIKLGGGGKVLFCNLSQKGGNMLGHEHIKIISRKSGPKSYQMSQTEARVHPHLVTIKMKIPGAVVTTAPTTVV